MIALLPLRHRLMTHSAISMSLKDYHLDIKKEVEAILNHMCVHAFYGNSWRALNQSLLSYGLSDDLKWAPFERLQDPEYLILLAKSISTHEPRLKNCTIHPLEDGLKKQKITLMIEGDIEFSKEVSSWQCIAYCQPIQRRFRIS
jgi:predicted component of type VI protein secretion system